jgi:hypothetical protein
VGAESPRVLDLSGGSEVPVCSKYAAVCSRMRTRAGGGVGGKCYSHCQATVGRTQGGDSYVATVVLAYVPPKHTYTITVRLARRSSVATISHLHSRPPSCESSPVA